MAETATLARPYANAAFDIAHESGSLDRWSRMLAHLSAASGAPKVREMIASPSLPSEAKAHQLADVMGDELDQAGRRFLMVLADNKRLEVLPEIAEQFEVLKAEAEKTLDVEIISAVELEPGEQDALVGALGRRYSQDIHVTTRVDESLVAGAIIRAGDTVIDGSVRGKLEKLHATLT